MPGRRFASPADFNDQFTDWLGRANARVVRTIKAGPVDLIDADRAAMLPLPPIPPHLGRRNKIRLGRDYYVRLDTNDYSVDPQMIGRMVDVAVGPGRSAGRQKSRRKRVPHRELRRAPDRRFRWSEALFGAACRNRTDDLFITSESLYRLS
jgi:hypothetical protein